MQTIGRHWIILLSTMFALHFAIMNFIESKHNHFVIFNLFDFENHNFKWKLQTMNFFAKTLFWYIHVDRCLCCENNYLTNKCVYFDCSMTDDNVLYTGRLHKCVWYCQARTNLKVVILHFQLICNEIIFDFYRCNIEKHFLNQFIEQKYYIFFYQ